MTAQAKIKTALDLVTEQTLRKQSQAIATAEHIEHLKGIIPDALRAQVQMYFRMIGLRDFSAVDVFFAWAGDRIYMDPDKAAPVGIELCDEYKRERPYLFFPTPVEEPQIPRPRVFVDETIERQVHVGMLVVKFRPNEELTDAHAIQLAQQHGVSLREGFERPSAPRPAGSATYAVVAEEVDRYVSVGASTVVFRSGETLADPYKVQLARAHGIALSER